MTTLLQSTPRDMVIEARSALALKKIVYLGQQKLAYAYAHIARYVLLGKWWRDVIIT